VRYSRHRRRDGGCDWSLLSRHGSILFYIAANPDTTVKHLAEDFSLTRRTIWSVIGDLRGEGELSEEEVAEVVDAEGGLEAVLRLRARAEDQSGVVDEYVEAIEAFEEVGSEGADGGEGGEVEGHEVGLDGGAAADLVDSVLAPVGVAGGEGDGGAGGGEGEGGLKANAGVAAGDEDGLALHVTGHDAPPW